MFDLIRHVMNRLSIPAETPPNQILPSPCNIETPQSPKYALTIPFSLCACLGGLWEHAGASLVGPSQSVRLGPCASEPQAVLVPQAAATTRASASRALENPTALTPSPSPLPKSYTPNLQAAEHALRDVRPEAAHHLLQHHAGKPAGGGES